MIEEIGLVDPIKTSTQGTCPGVVICRRSVRVSPAEQSLNSFNWGGVRSRAGAGAKRNLS